MNNQPFKKNNDQGGSRGNGRDFRFGGSHRIRTYRVPSQTDSAAGRMSPAGTPSSPATERPMPPPRTDRRKPVHLTLNAITAGQRPQGGSGNIERKNQNHRQQPHGGQKQRPNRPQHQGGGRNGGGGGRNSGGGGGRQKRGGHPMRRPTGAPRQAPAKQGARVAPPAKGIIRIIPIGGVEEIGRNMSLVEYGDDIIVVDAGLQFASDQTPGVDYLLPNTAYLEERKDRIRALVVTHGHLDHIGAIPFIIERLGNPPIYTRDFGAMLIKKRHDEYPHLPPIDLKIVGADSPALPIGKDLKVLFFGLTHSIPDSSGVIIQTPHGDLVFTGDVRVENENGVPDEREQKQYGIFKDRNVLFLAMDSTGIERPGWALPERRVVEAVDKIVAASGGRILIATFASQVERIIAFIDIAKKYGRLVAIDGRSMKTNVEIIKKLQLAEAKHTISIDEIGGHPPNKIMILVTGAQGEEFAALMRIANGTHKQVKLSRSDTVILSSSVIPGNERAVTTLKDNLYRHDAKVITYLDSDVHTSGHGKRGELEWIHRQIPYRFFMPLHGHHFMLKMHAELSQSLGHAPASIVVPENGTIIEIDPAKNTIRKLDAKVPATPLTVDGFAIGDIQDVVIRDRQMLAEEGMFVIVASVNASTGKLRKSPDIISRGFVYLRESQDLLREVRDMIKKSIEGATEGQRPIDFDNVKNVLTDAVSRFLLQKTAKRPIVIPVLLGF